MQKIQMPNFPRLTAARTSPPGRPISDRSDVFVSISLFAFHITFAVILSLSFWQARMLPLSFHQMFPRSPLESKHGIPDTHTRRPCLPQCDSSLISSQPVLRNSYVHTDNIFSPYLFSFLTSRLAVTGFAVTSCPAEFSAR